MTELDYLIFLIAFVAVAIFSMIVQSLVTHAFSKYNKVPNSTNTTGKSAAERILRSQGLYDVKIAHIGGSLTDQYDPRMEVVSLSDSTHDVTSIASVAVAAHEVGHATQKHDGYFLFKFRHALVPVVNWGSRLALPIVVIGVIVDALVALSDSEVGFYIAMFGVALYGGALLFALVTLPLEINASRRAIRLLDENGILTNAEQRGARKVLAAAAMTYLVSVLTALIYFFRFLIYVLLVFGKNRD